MKAFGGDCAAVEAQALARAQRFFQVCFFGRDVFFTHFAQCDAGTVKLLCSLQEIAAVGPQSGPVRCDEQRTRAAGKAGDIAAAFEVVADVFRTVEIVAGDQISVNFFLHHTPAQVG